jgi:aspartate-semialdehyde dehydrogenase
LRKKIAVLGATGLVGQQFAWMLADHPYFEIEALAASDRSAGKRYGARLEHVVGGTVPGKLREFVVESIDPKSLAKRGVEIAFSALPSETAGSIETELANLGIAVFTNASAHRMDPDVPVIIPEANAEHIALVDSQRKRRPGFIVADSNCSVSGLVIALKPLMQFGLKDVTITTYQAVSGAGYPGEASLDVIGNIIPFIENEEGKVEKETRRILGTLSKGRIRDASFDINATCARVPVHYGHLESVVAELETCPDPREIVQTLRKFRGVPQKLLLPTAPLEPLIVKDDEYRPQPLLDSCAGTPERAAGMSVTVGRIAKKGRKLRFILLVHNTIRGAAGTSILNAELALKQKYL